MGNRFRKSKTRVVYSKTGEMSKKHSFLRLGTGRLINRCGGYGTEPTCQDLGDEILKLDFGIDLGLKFHISGHSYNF